MFHKSKYLKWIYIITGYQKKKRFITPTPACARRPSAAPQLPAGVERPQTR